MELFASSQAGLLACALLMALLLLIRYVRHARRAVDGWFGAATPARPELYGSYLRVIAPRPGPMRVPRTRGTVAEPIPALVVIEEAPVVEASCVVEDPSAVEASCVVEAPSAVEGPDSVEEELVVEPAPPPSPRPCRLVAAAASLPAGRSSRPSWRSELVGEGPASRAVALRQPTETLGPEAGELRVLSGYESVDPGDEEVDPRFWAVG